MRRGRARDVRKDVLGMCGGRAGDVLGMCGCVWGGGSCGGRAGGRDGDPVSKMTVNFCLGVPMPTSMKYCVPFWFTTGMRSTCA